MTFSFPPPPPPPPPKGAPNPSPEAPYGATQRGRGRGRGWGRENHARGSFTGPDSGFQRKRSFDQYTSARENAFGPISTASLQSQSYHSNFGGGSSRLSPRQQGRPSAPPKVNPAPAVPAFGVPLPMASSLSGNDTTPRGHRAGIGKKKREYNALGLTPRKEEHESSEDDADEESRLATKGGELKIEYKGQTSFLKSQSDIASWIAERKKRFPTKARAEEKRKEDEEMKQRNDLARLRQKLVDDRKHNVEQKAKHETSQTRELGKREAKIARLKARLEKEEAKIVTSSHAADEVSTQQPAILDGKLADLSSNESDSDDSSDISSSDLSSSEDDAPEEVSSKIAENMKHEQAPIERKPCPFFAKGRCKHGSNCRFDHGSTFPRTKPVQLPPSPAPSGRKSLHDRLVEQEQKERDLLALQAIKYLGKLDFFTAPNGEKAIH